MMNDISPEIFHEICQLTFELTKLRKESCDHLCVENTGPQIFSKLISSYRGEQTQEIDFSRFVSGDQIVMEGD